MNYEERIPLNSLLGSQHGQRSNYEPGTSMRLNSRAPMPNGAEASSEVLEHLISIVLQGNIFYLEKLLKNEEVLDVIDLQDNKGFTALHIACDKYDPDCTRLLLAAGADPNVTDRYKRTAMHWVVNGGCRCDTCNTKRAKCTELLVAAKVNLEAEDYENETALYYAARNALQKPAAVMLENGAEISRCANGVSLGHLIVQKIPEVMIQLLDGSIAYDNVDNSKLKLDFGVLIDASRRADSFENEDAKLSIRDSNGKPRKETDLLSYMMRAHPTGREALLTHPVTEAFLHLKWLYVRKWFWFIRIFYCLLTLVYTYFIFDLYVYKCNYYDTFASEENRSNCTHLSEKPEATPLFILAVCIGTGAVLMLLNQVYKFCTGPCYYIKSVLNFGWWILMACIGGTVLPTLGIGLDMWEWQYPVAALGLFTAWSMNLAHLNHLPYFGVYIEMLWKVIQKLIIVAATFSSLFIAFVLGFCLLFPKNEFFKEIPLSLIKSTLMMLGDRDYHMVFNQNEESRLAMPHYAIPIHLLYFAFLFLFGIILMNLLLGLAVSDVQLLQRNAELSQVCRQIKEIAVLESFATSKCLSSCFTRCILSAISVRSRNGRFFSFSPTDPDDKSLPSQIKSKFIPYMKSRPCLNREKSRRSILGPNLTFMPTGVDVTGRGSQNGGRYTPIRSHQENIDEILNDLRNRLEGLNHFRF